MAFYKMILTLATFATLTANAGGGGGGGYDIQFFEPTFITQGYLVEDVTSEWRARNDSIYQAKSFQKGGQSFFMIEYWGNDRGATYIAGVTPQELISLMGEIKMICDNDTFMSTSGPINIIHCDSTELSRGFILQVDSNWFLLGPGR